MELKERKLCGQVAIANANAGVALCNREEGHEGECWPHPSFYDYC